jgi:hypothetical protein
MQAKIDRSQDRLTQAENSRTYLGEALREKQEQLLGFEAFARVKEDYERALSAISSVLEVVRDICPDSYTLQSARIIPDSTWIVERHQLMVLNLPQAGQAPELYDLHRLDLHQLEIELIEAGEFRDALEFRVDLRNQHGRTPCAGYRHTPAALSRMSPDRIARDLAPHVAHMLKQKFG